MSRTPDRLPSLSERNFSLDQQLVRLADAHTPKYRFSGESREDWKAWHDALKPAAIATLGKRPEKVPLNGEVVAEWTEDGLIKQRVVFDVEDGLAVQGSLFRPAGATGKLPAILCCHGHGPYGKEAVMGKTGDSALQSHIRELNYDYGLQMAKSGYVTMAIDWRGFGVRDDRKRPYRHDIVGQRDICNMLLIREMILGRTPLGMNVHDGTCALDYLCEQDFVDADRLGVMGLSFGGTMTTWISLFDERVRAADILCYSDRFSMFAMRFGNTCGNQLTPGLFELCDVPDLHGLSAPKPLLVEIGTYDDCFDVESALSCYREVEKIYAAAGASENLELDLFEGGHAWGANKTRAFFDKHLSGR
jgi:dienelactone hydrolase